VQAETAKALVQAIADATGIAAENRSRITALENLIAKHRYDFEGDLFQEYENELALLKRNPPIQLSVLGFGRLQELLAQD